MSTVAELKKRFEQSKSVVLTPEQHAKALRQKERDLQEATRIAKARAARYNMTLRSLELTNVAKNTEQEKIDREKRDMAFKTFAQPGRRVSNMKQSVQARVEMSQQILGSALSHTASPETAVEVVNAIAQQVEETLKTENVDADVDADAQARAKQEADEQAIAIARHEEERRLAEETAEKEKQAAAAKAAEEEARTKAAAEEEAAAEAARKAEEEAAAAKAAEEVEEKPVDDGARFEMTSLSEALDQGNEEAINKAVVVDFLAEHDPARLPEVEKLLEDNKGKEDELMRNLAEKYTDPEETEIKVTAEVIVKIEAEGKVDPPPAPAEDDDVDYIEQQRREAERLKLEEEAKIAAMDENERKAYMEKLAAQAKHSEEKDKMLKSQLNVYGNGASAALLGGRGRGRGKARPKSGHSEYIVSAVNQGGAWEVNAE